MTDAGISRLSGLLLSCTLTVAGFAAWSWPLPEHLSTHTLALVAAAPADAGASASQPDWSVITANDQNLSLWGAAENARALVGGDWRALLAQGQCYPMPSASVLGEHMIELGILASPWWLLSGDPVLAFNLSFVTALLIAATGMFLFLHRHTGSVPAAIAGAIAFAFASPRLVDLPSHPAVVGTHWIPWVLWSFDGVLAGERGIAVIVFAASLLLSVLVGSYPTMEIGLVGAGYGAVAIAGRLRRSELKPAAIAWCAAAAVPAVAAIAAILLRYSGVQHEWAVATHPGARFLVAPSDYLPGGIASAGIVALLGIAALLLRRDPGRVALPALAAATGLVFVLVTTLPLPGLATQSLYDTLAAHLALLHSVRGPGKAALAVGFGLQALGAIGWSRCMQGIGPRAGALLATLLVTLTMLEASPPRLLRGVLGSGAAMELREMAPPRQRIDTLMAALGDARDRRAVLDLPTGRMAKAPVALRDAAWHGHPTSACYNSLVPPTMRASYALAARSHSERGVMELAAAGFGFVIDRPSTASPALSPTAFPAPARLLAFDKDIAIWGLPHTPAVHHDLARLALVATGGATRGATFAPDPPHELDLEVTNGSDRMWAAPQPLAPLFAQLELAAPDGSIAFRSIARGVLPLALSPGASTTVQLTLPEAPAPGPWRASIRIDGAPQATAAADFRWSVEAR